MIYNLQILRAVAASMVFLHHFLLYLRPVAGEGGLVEFGAAGVDIFFVISGVVMMATTTGRDTAPVDFLVRRAARLVPIYTILTLLVVLLVLGGLRPIGVLDVRLHEVVQSLLFIPFRRGEFVQPLLTVGWTLNYEMFFYAVFAVLLPVRSEPFRLALLVSAMVGLGLASLLEPTGLYARFYTQPIVIEFALGAVLGFAYVRSRHRAVGPRWRPLGYGLIAAGVLLLAASELVGHGLGVGIESLPFCRLLLWGSAGLSIVAGALLVERTGDAWNAPFLVALGGASYAIYLIHSLVLHASFKVATALVPGGWPAVGLTFALAAPVTAALGALLYRTVEMPLNRGLRTAFDRSGARPGMQGIAGLRRSA